MRTHLLLATGGARVFPAPLPVDRETDAAGTQPRSGLGGDKTCHDVSNPVYYLPYITVLLEVDRGIQDQKARVL